MNNTYNKSYVSLQTVKHDTTVLDAQKILIKTPKDSITSRTDLIDYIGATANTTIDNAKSLIDDLQDKVVLKSDDNWKEVKTQIITGPPIFNYFTTNLENRTNGTEGEYIKIDK